MWAAQGIYTMELCVWHLRHATCVLHIWNCHILYSVLLIVCMESPLWPRQVGLLLCIKSSCLDTQNPMKSLNATPYMVTHTVTHTLSHTLWSNDVNTASWGSALRAYEMILKIYTCREDLWTSDIHAWVISPVISETKMNFLTEMVVCIPALVGCVQPTQMLTSSTYTSSTYTLVLVLESSGSAKSVSYVLCTLGSVQIPLVMENLCFLSRCSIPLAASVELLPDIILHAFIITWCGMVLFYCVPVYASTWTDGLQEPAVWTVHLRNIVSFHPGLHCIHFLLCYL